MRSPSELFAQLLIWGEIIVGELAPLTSSNSID